MHMTNCLDGELIEEYDGGYANVFRGEWEGRAVAVKILRLHLTSDLDKCSSVSISTSDIADIPTDTGIPEILSRSRRMEASPTSEHLTVVGCESKLRAVPARHDIRMDGSR